LNSRINKLIKDRDKARSILEERNTQLKEKDAKIFFFQAENFRLKNLSEEASFAYQKAIKKDPENQTYRNRMKSLNKDLTIDSK